MNNAAFTVILPHKRNVGNDAALRICLSCLIDNTVNEFVVLQSVADDQPLYATINDMVAIAPTDCCFYINSDMFVAPGWDVPMLELYDNRTIVTGVLVEPGIIAMHHLNLQQDFGRTPETFRRDEFEEWTKTAPVIDGEGWAAPLMFSRLGHLYLGGFDTSLGEFPDIALDNRLIAKGKEWGNRKVRAPAFIYHLQGYSSPEEQTKVGRR